MNITASISNVIATRKRLGRITERVQTVLDQEVAKDSNVYCPEDQGDLKDSVYLSRMGSGILTWDQVYAKRLYHGLDFNFSKDKNPNASPKWFERAKKVRLRHWLEVAQYEYRK